MFSWVNYAKISNFNECTYFCASRQFLESLLYISGSRPADFPQRLNSFLHTWRNKVPLRRLDSTFFLILHYFHLLKIGFSIFLVLLLMICDVLIKNFTGPKTVNDSSKNHLFINIIKLISWLKITYFWVI